MSAPTASRSALWKYVSPVGAGSRGLSLPPPQAPSIDDRQTSVSHFLCDMTFAFRLVRQGAFVAHTAGFMHEELGKNQSRFREDSRQGACGGWRVTDHLVMRSSPVRIFCK